MSSEGVTVKYLQKVGVFFRWQCSEGKKVSNLRMKRDKKVIITTEKCRYFGAKLTILIAKVWYLGHPFFFVSDNNIIISLRFHEFFVMFGAAVVSVYLFAKHSGRILLKKCFYIKKGKTKLLSWDGASMIHDCHEWWLFLKLSIYA